MTCKISLVRDCFKALWSDNDLRPAYSSHQRLVEGTLYGLYRHMEKHLAPNNVNFQEFPHQRLIAGALYARMQEHVLETIITHIEIDQQRKSY